jgi:hypothetical protein
MSEGPSPRDRLLGKIIDFCQKEKKILQAKLVLLESGDHKTGERKAAASRWIDTTQKAITLLRARILEIDTMLLLIWEANIAGASTAYD